MQQWKKKWEQPKAVGQIFTANEYVAACGDGGNSYMFECNAGSRSHRYDVYLNGADDKPHTKDDVLWAGTGGQHSSFYTPCGRAIPTSSGSVFQKGYICEHSDWGDILYPEDVIVWTNDGTDTHCTTNLDMNSWEFAKS